MALDEPTLVAFLIAFFPGVVATLRGHCAVWAIWALNLLALILMASIVGFVLGVLVGLAALIWALGSNTKNNRRRNSEAIGKAVSDALALDRAAQLKE